MSHEPIVVSIETHFDPATAAAEPYPLVPFDLPPGVVRVAVSYTYSDPIGAGVLDTRPGNVVDLGLLAPDGFRGWSGSARRSAVLSPAAATPGYIPGPLPPGRWHVLLGLYKMSPRGCDVRIDVEAWTAAGEFDAAPRPPSPVGECPGTSPSPLVEPAWVRGDLHCHSHHSEAQGSLSDLLAAARAQGLDFLAVTEHNTISHLVEMAARPMPPSPVVIPAVEITTYHGHANAFGIRAWPDFRCRSAADMAALRAALQAEGVLFSINHPKTAGPPWEWGGEDQADAIEVWQQPWPLFNYQSLLLWDRLLREGRRIVALGGSDKHQDAFDGSLGFHEVGRPATWLYAGGLSVASLLAALRAGHAFISAGPAGPRLELDGEAAKGRAMMGDELLVLPDETAAMRCRVSGAAGQWLRLVSRAARREIPIDGDDRLYEWPASAADGYWRAEVVEPPPPHQRDEPAAQMLVALSNPIYLTSAS